MDTRTYADQKFVVAVTRFALSPAFGAKGEFFEREFIEFSPFLEDFGDFPEDTIPREEGIYVWEGSVVEENTDGDYICSFNGKFRLAAVEDLTKFGLKLAGPDITTEIKRLNVRGEHGPSSD